MRALVLSLLVLTGIAVPVRGGAAASPQPIVLIPGWHGEPASFDAMIPVLEEAGLPVVDFNPDMVGTQALSFAPTERGQHISYIAGEIVEEAIDAALRRNGYAPDTLVDVVAYSMGGLLARFLVEQPSADVERFSTIRGWFGDGDPDVAGDWAGRVDDLIMLGTPSHGTWVAFVPGTVGGFGKWNASGGDMRRGSEFLTRMGVAEPSGERYVTIGGEAKWLPVPRSDFNGDGRAHGYDGLVPAESPFLTGSDQYVVPVQHRELVTDPQALDLVLGELGRRAAAPPAPGRNLEGDLSVRLEHAAVASDHDWGTSDEFRFVFSVDPDGGRDSYVPLGSFDYRRDAPFAQDWGDTGPLIGALRLPGTSPRLDVRLDVIEEDPWGDQAVATATFADAMLSDDLDGMDYYEVEVPIGKGHRHLFRISLNGVTSRPG